MSVNHQSDKQKQMQKLPKHSWIRIGTQKSIKRCVTCGIIHNSGTGGGIYTMNGIVLENKGCKKLDY